MNLEADGESPRRRPYVGSARPPAGATVPPPAVDGEAVPAASDAVLPSAVGRASVPPTPPSPVETPDDVPGEVSGTALVVADRALAARGSATVPRPGAVLSPAVLAAEEESSRYVEGRPGQVLAESLAEQRLKELPSTKDVTRAQDERRRIMPLWQELPLLVIVSFCVAVLVRSFFVQAFVIPSGSMEDTLLVGDRVLVSKIAYEFRDPERGDVVVFRGTERWAPENVDEAPGGVLDRIGDTLGDLVGVSRPGEKDFIKRVIGIPGDRVSCCDGGGRVMVNGVGIEEPYLKSNNPLNLPASVGVCASRYFAEVVVPAGELFVMGDNRGVSQDSRCQGTVPIENVVGRAFLRVWPLGHLGGIGMPDTFGGVPDPATALVVLGLTTASGPGNRRWRRPRTLRR